MIKFKVEDNKLWQILKRVNFNPILNGSERKAMYILKNEALKRVPKQTWKLKRSHIIKYENLFGTLINMSPYWKYVHYWTIYQSSQPWLTDSLTAKEKEIYNIFDRDIEKYLKKL